MKIKKYTVWKFVTGLALAGALFTGCQPAAPVKKQSRNKMPEDQPDTIEHRQKHTPIEKLTSESTVFPTSNVEVRFNGRRQNFTSVSFPDPDGDAAVLTMVNKMKPYALAMISTWAKLGQGVLIDLSNHTGETLRTSFTLQRDGDFSIPVMVISDKGSASRLKTIESIISDVPSLTLKRVQGDGFVVDNEFEQQSYQN